MKEHRVTLLQDSFADIEKDMTAALNEDNKESVHYHFLRTYRLLGKLERGLTQMDSLRSAPSFVLRNNIQQKISKWHAQMAYTYEKDGLIEESEREWLSALSHSQGEPDYFLQYAHTALRNKGLSVDRDLSENLQLINHHNVVEINQCLKRVRLAVKTAVSEQGSTEATGYFFTMLDFLEKEIASRSDLSQALNTSNEEQTLDETLAELQQLIGMETVKRKIKEICDWVYFSKLRREQGLKADEISLHMVFSGNPGTGKTTVARIVAKIYKALGFLKKGHLVEATRSDLVAEYVGQTAIKTMKKIKEAENGVLFIDEAYSLTRSDGNDFGIEAIDTLVKAMEDQRKNLVVILAGYPKEMRHFIKSNPGLYSRFKFQIDFPDYSIDELMEIHSFLLAEKQYKVTDPANTIVRSIIQRKIHAEPDHHGNGRLVRNIIEDEILNKAAFVVERNRNNLPVSELDIIDETIMRMVETGLESNEERERKQSNKVISIPLRE